MSIPVLAMSDVTVRRAGKTVLEIDRLTVHRGEILSIIGPNGAGKSTLLQTANLLLSPDSGHICLFGQSASKHNQLLLRRRCSLLFQEALFTSNTVFFNVALPLRFRGYDKKEIERRVMQALSTVSCEHLAERQAQRLSGGEAQRVSLARALAVDPELLLLDEPFSSLDPAARSDMIAEFRQIIADKGITAMVVSHSMEDVLFVSERTVVMDGGRIIQQDKPEAVMRKPRTEAVARLVGMDNIIACTLQPVPEGTKVTLEGGWRFVYRGAVPAKSRFCTFPGDIFALLDENRKPDTRQTEALAVVKRVIPGIGACQVIAQVGECQIKVRLSREIAVSMVPEQIIRLAFDAQEMHFLA